jgi:predicted dehydrogenase
MAELEGLSRREFVKGAAMTLAMLAGAEELRADPPAPAPAGPPVPCGVIGLGDQGRELLKIVARLGSGSPIVAICDHFEPAFKKAQEIAPKAALVTDYRQLLADKKIQAVFIATPSHLHKEVALAAIQAGKHVYCEAPLASTIDEAREIAKAGMGSKQVFQVGQQARGNPQHWHVRKFVWGGVLGTPIAQARAQWHRRDSWRRAHGTPEREKALNWRLNKATSAGLMGEVGIHQVDVASMFLKSLPLSVSGFGAVTCWQDGREIADTVQCLFEYPGGVRFGFDGTLANSFDGAYELYQGPESAVVLRGERAWLIKENDAPVLGWEVYARKEKIGDNETGICLVADASKLIALGKNPGDAARETGKDALYYSVEDFFTTVRTKAKPKCGPLEGFQAAVVAIKANEAVMTGTKITYQKEWFTLA